MLFQKPLLGPANLPSTNLIDKIFSYVGLEEEKETVPKVRKPRSNNRKDAKPYRNMPGVFSLNDDESGNSCFSLLPFFSFDVNRTTTVLYIKACSESFDLVQIDMS